MTTDALVAGVRAMEPGSRALAAEFSAFYTDQQPRLIRYCYRLVHDEQAAFDLTQESFARLFTRWVSLREPAAYLFHVATNLARTDYRRRCREDAAYAAKPPPAPPADDRHVHLRLAVERLPPRYREIVLLYYFADLNVADVARAVRRPNGTVARQLSEARALLATDLKDDDV
jgi:RNA polymerase sigma-70 factor (ECF subfamily)